MLLATVAWAEGTLLDASRAIDAAVMPVLLRYGSEKDLTWGQKTALDDLDRLNKAAGGLVGALQGDSTPDSLRPLITDLDVARTRVKASLQLLTLNESEQQSVEAALLTADRLSGAVRHLADRFSGRDQPAGVDLADTPLDPVDRPYYENPRELLGEAQNIRFSAERLLGACYAPGGWRPGLGTPFTISDLVELSRAARDYEWACQSRYRDVSETVPAFLRLARAYDRVSYMPYGPFSGFEAHNIERALERLSRFYGRAAYR
ncbi:hypothetical protein DYH09_18885 [bacterium CPR1]|nr:hypothetical protein [bacterium CPR1]